MASPTPIRLLKRAWYAATFDVFLAQSDDEIVGILTQQSNHAVELTQRDAWLAEIELLRRWLKGRSGTLLLEFNIPRMGLRADAVVVIAGCIVILEFKVGDSTVGQGALNQVWQHALDTKNFHETSHQVPIIPVLVPTELAAGDLAEPSYAHDWVRDPVALAPQQVPKLLDDLSERFVSPIDSAAWEAGRYRPTPTIIEAARHLYAQHEVSDIVRTEAGATNLTDTARRLEGMIQKAQRQGEKLICFVTGVPGAGRPHRDLRRGAARLEPAEDHAVHAPEEESARLQPIGA